VSAQQLSTTQIGRTQVSVSPLGLGCAPLGHPLFGVVSEAQAVETIHAALENGVTLFDAAPYYGGTLVEQRLGLALSGVPRDRYTLSTKVGRLLVGDEHLTDYSPDGVRRSIAGSLERMRTDVLDIVHIHDPDADTYRAALDDVYPVLDDLRDKGVVRAIGIGVNEWELLSAFARDAHFDCFLLAGRYTLLEQGARDAMNRFHAQGISILAAGVYNTGILATGAREGAWYQYAPAPPAILARVRRLEAVCARYSVPLPAAAVQFVAAHPAVASLVIGAGSADEARANAAVYRAPIPAGLWEDLRAEGLIDPAAPVPGAPQ
jgi:D-threo-aldose 1-dehydrogenase